MAECQQHVCTHCGRAVSAWSDGNPYYLDAAGKKRYAYHPDHEHLALCIGNDEPHRCLNCGAETRVDSRRPRTTCRRCKTGPLANAFDLAGRQCPYCRVGEFALDPTWHIIS